MGKINVLDFSVANLIAAGEVVERPASVVKELLENSIDSGADLITVEIKNGGVSFIRVADNGCGMEAEDLPVALKRHATSKIHRAEDLDGILTLGFRGEALAAISSVSEIRILSRTAARQTGTALSASGGQVTDVSECGCSPGTTVIVENLFANVPARRKFLKKDATEALAVSAVVEKIALSHAEISIKLISDGVLRFATSGDGVVLNAIYAVLGREFATRLIEISGEMDGVSVHGFVSRPDNVRSNRSFQNVFINGRYIRSKTVGAALEQAFSSYIPSEKFPACVMFLHLAPGSVDVNVHPAKLEVKFTNEKAVFEAVYYAVRSALERRVTRPEMTLNTTAEREMRETQTLHAFAPIRESVLPKQPYRQSPQIAIADTGIFSQHSSAPAPESPARPAAVHAVETSRADGVTPPPSVPRDKLPVQNSEPQMAEYRISGVLFDCYILAEHDDLVTVIDKHAAHERILFETLKENIRRAERATQLLLLPLEIKLAPMEYAALQEYDHQLENTGFAAEFKSENRISVTEIPVCIEQERVPDMVIAMARKLADGTGDAAGEMEAVYEKALYQASCKAAVKAGRHDEPETIAWICERVMNDPQIRFCPHGRPVALEMKKSDFDRQFSRT